MAVVQMMVIWFLHCIMIKCSEASEEHNACTLKVTELVQVDAEVMQ